MPYLKYIDSDAMAAYPEWFPDAAEPEHSVANIETADLLQLSKRLLQVSWDDVEAVVNVRSDGGSQRLTTALLHEPLNLTDSHILAGRFPTPEEQKLHKFGLILGSIACNDFHASRSLGSKRLQADDPEAFAKAHHKSYKTDARLARSDRKLMAAYNDWPETPWFRERYRELHLTGTDAFSTLYAMTRGHTEDLLRNAPNEEWRATSYIPETEAATAVLSGMVDARRFFLNYQRNIDGRHEYVNQYRVHKSDAMPVPFYGDAFELPQNTPAETALELLEHGKSEWAWYDVRYGNVAGKFLTQSSIMQVGPSTFQRGHFLCVPRVKDDFYATYSSSIWQNPNRWMRLVMGILERHEPDYTIEPSTDLNQGDQDDLECMSNVTTMPRSVMLPMKYQEI